MGTIVVEAACRVSTAQIHINRLDLVERGMSVLHAEDRFRLDLCVTRRLPSQMRFSAWNPHRFEQAGKLFLVPPGEALTVWNSSGRETDIVCDIYTEAIGEALSDDVCRPTYDLDNCLKIESRPIEHALLRMADEVIQPGFATDVIVESLTLQIAVYLYRWSQDLSSISATCLPEWRMRRIEERLRSIDIAPQLGELAKLCGLSVRQLSRSFKAKHGVSIGKYVAQRRVERAQVLLEQKISIKEVATRLGFASTASFCAAFKSATGRSPNGFRQRAGV